MAEKQNQLLVYFPQERNNQRPYRGKQSQRGGGIRRSGRACPFAPLRASSERSGRDARAPRLAPQPVPRALVVPLGGGFEIDRARHQVFADRILVECYAEARL